MKKTLVAVAALAAFAGAHAEATISGFVESTYATSKASKGLTTGLNGGTEVRVGASEDLGSGMKAEFSYVLIGDINTNISPVTYNSFIGLSGEFGSVKLGEQFTPIFSAQGATDAWGGAATINNAVVSQITTNGVHLQNTVNYASPSIAGVSLAVQGTNDNTITGYSLSYAAGSFNAAYASQRDATDANAVVTSSLIGAAYDFGVAKLFLNNATSTGSLSATSYGIAVPYGAFTFLASASTNNTAGDHNTTNLGAKYNLSKRTQVYFLNTTDSTNAVTNAIGINHAF